MDKEITFDIEKFLNEDCKEENEIGIKMTSSILRKAFEKGLQNSAYYCYEKGKNDAKTEFITLLTELQLEIEKTVNEEKSNDIKWAIGLRYSKRIIQQKIDKLREGKL